ncbi:MAG: gliding motility protein GldM [Ferruginibacter sp.]
MALPKEPRQKMINIMYLVLTAILALNVSAEILNAFKVVDASLLKSNASIEGSNKTIFESLKQKAAKAETAEKTAIWKPRAEQAQVLSEKVLAKLEEYKEALKRNSGYNPEKGINDFKEDHLDAATRLFITDGKGPEMKKMLEDYQADIYKISPEVAAKFKDKLPIDLSIPPSKTGSNNTWEYSYFHMTPTIAAITMLSKFENDVKNSENQVVSFCHDQIGQVEVIYNKSVALVSQSSNYIMPGQKIKVKAGVGIFSSAAAPKITIGGQSFNAAEGFAETELDAGGAGAHTLPVTIVYKGQDGKDVTVTDKVEYTVGVPGGAAVMLDKMNVFYIGVDNPITISSGSGWDKTSVSMTGGTLSGSNSNRIVRVTNPGTATINVSADGKSSKFDFRVKMIPDPIGMIGPSKGGRIQSNVFKAQDFLRAELLNFDFDARFNVTSAVVYFAGAGFSTGGGVQTGQLTSGSLAPIKAKMDLCKPGSTVTFDDLKVVGPDGRTRTIPPISFVLF